MLHSFVQEWVIAENNEVDKKLQLIKQDAADIGEDKPSVLCTTYDELFRLASTQSPLLVSKCMVFYATLLMSPTFSTFFSLGNECEVHRQVPRHDLITGREL